MRLLLAIDESLCAEAAVSEVEEHFTMPDTTVRVLHVVGKFVPPAATLWYDAGGNPQAAHEEVVSRYQALLETVAERLAARGITVEAVVKDGDPGKTIVQEAKEWRADLIIVGFHGHSRLRRIVMGDVSQYVIDHAPCSVEIAHRKESEY